MRRTLELRRPFVEERFLHQTRVKTPAGIVCFDDLPEALAANRGAIGGIPRAGSSQGIDLWAHPWRVHYHLPIDSQSLLNRASAQDSSPDPDSGVTDGAIATTRDDMLKAYHHAVARGLCRHFEIETYTWTVLPEAHRPKDDAELARCLAGELRFIEAQTPAGILINGAANGSSRGREASPPGADESARQGTAGGAKE